ncbi:MAG: LysR family transcriptional regulator [Pseudomonadota bacterium]
MDVQDIELVKAVEEEGSISRACVRLNISQPTLSKKLARLEQVLGTRLFQRYSKGLVATDTARYILSKAKPLRDQINEIERHIELINQMDAGELRLGVGPIIEQLMLPDVLRVFTESTGNVRLSIVTESEETLLRMLRGSKLDVVVGPFQARDQDGEHLLAFPMIEDEIIAVVRKGHPLLGRKSYKLLDLIEYSWVAPKAQGTVQQTSDHPVFSKMKISSDNYSLLKQLTIRSDVICAGPSAVFKQELADKFLIEVPVSLEVTWESALLVRPETLATPLGKHLVSLFTTLRDSYSN